MSDQVATTAGDFALRRVTAKQRQELQRRWQLGQQLLATPGARARGLDQLATCVRDDPGNRFYVETFLRAAATQPRRWSLGLRHWPERRRWRDALNGQRWDEVLRRGPLLLAAFPAWPAVPLAMADACRHAALQDAERAYARHARDMAPRDLGVQRRWAEFLMRAADFEQARAAWELILQQDPSDERALWAQQLVNPSSDERAATESTLQALSLRLAEKPLEVGQVATQARQWLEKGWLDSAGRALAIARAAAPGDWELVGLGEDCTLAQAQRDVEVTQAWTVREGGPDAVELLKKARELLDRVRLEIAAARSLRQPNDAPARWELAQRLQQAGQWGPAAQHADLLSQDPRWSAAAWLLEGECLQQMRRFPQALQRYRQAAREAENLDPEQRLRLWYREAVLSEALGEMVAARRRLEDVVRSSPDYRDAAERLDKLRQMPHTT